jgi:hypothetical protein
MYGLFRRIVTGDLTLIPDSFLADPPHVRHLGQFGRTLPRRNQTVQQTGTNCCHHLKYCKEAPTRADVPLSLRRCAKTVIIADLVTNTKPRGHPQIDVPQLTYELRIDERHILSR